MQGEIENQPGMDDWGDFSAVISGLEQTEVSELTDLPTEAANDDNHQPAGEMFEGALSVLFTIAEQATSIIITYREVHLSCLPVPFCNWEVVESYHPKIRHQLLQDTSCAHHFHK